MADDEWTGDDEAFARQQQECEESPCQHHKTGEDTGELHEPHRCPKCGASCDGDSPCSTAEEVREIIEMS